MKLTGILLLAIIVLGCKSVSPEEKAKQREDSIRLRKALLPETEKRRIFKELVKDPSEFDYTKHLTWEEFYSQYYPADSLALKNYSGNLSQEYYGMEQELINPDYIDKKGKWFRLFMYPTFYNSFTLTVEKTERKSYKYTYRLSRMDGYFSMGTLFQYTGTPADTALFSSLFIMLDKFSFVNANDKEQCRGQDGNLWVFEYIEGNKYKKAEYGDPQRDAPCGSKEAYSLAIHCLNIIKKSPAYKILKADFSDGGKESPYGYLQLYPETLPAK